MDARNLRTFIKVSELSNFTKAATALGYSQSAVTVQMQQLEKELGIPLFDRIGKNICLTQYGRNFIEYANNVVDAMDKAENFANDSKELHGVIRFGIVDSILDACFIRILPEFNRRYPGVTVSLFVSSAREIEAKMRANELDVAYMLDYKVPSREWVRVREEIEPIIFVANPSHPFADGRKVTMNEIVEQKLILMPQGEGYRYLFDDELLKKNLFVNPEFEISDTMTIFKILETAPEYISMLPEFEVRNAVAQGRLAKINVDTESKLRQWSQLVYMKGKAVTPQLQAFISTVEELLPPLRDEN